MSARDTIEALIAGERDPQRLAELARGKMRAKRAELIAALDGRFDDHHSDLAQLLLAQITAMSRALVVAHAKLLHTRSFLHTRNHASHRTSPLPIRSNRA